jgi:Uma2 family endonuclease
MTAERRKRMTVDEFLAWAQAREGRYELFDGVAYAMSPERAGHAEVKLAVAKALGAAVARAKVGCWVLPDGMTVRVDKYTAHEPDALVYCGPKLPASAIEVPEPVIVVEVLPPSTRHVDASAKLAGYFRLPSVRHCLIVDPEQRLVICHARGGRDGIDTRVVRKGAIRLEPPGIRLAVAKLIAGA